MFAERREAGLRTHFTGGYLPPTARIRPGRLVVVVDLSCRGALVEGPWRFRPLSRCDMHLLLVGTDVHLRARIMRCYVARIDRQEPVRYRTALSFDQTVALPERWDALEGYSLPADLPDFAPRGVADSQAPVAASAVERLERQVRPISRTV